MSLQRLRTDFHYAILIVFCAVGLIALMPFTVLRFINGPLFVAVVDVAIMVELGLVLAYVWRGGNLENASLLVALLNTLSGILFGALLGLSGVLWSYPVVLANFLILSRRKAIVLSATLVLALVAQGTALETPMLMERYAAASVAVGVLAYLFSYRAEVQRGQLQRLARP